MPFSRYAHLAAAGILLVLAGCTASYRMSYLRSSFQAVPDYAEQAKNIRDAKLAIYDEIIQQTSTPAESPYPEMKQCLARMNQAMLDQKKAIPPVEPVRQEFEKFAVNREEITEKDPDWPRFQVLQSRCGSAINGVSRYTAQCAAEAQAFDKLMKDNGIEKIDVEEARRRLNKFYDETSARIDDLSLDVASAQARLMDIVTRGFDPVAGLKHQSALVRLEKRCGALKDERRTAGAELAKFTPGTFGNKRMAWTGPGLGEIPGQREVLDLHRDLEDTQKELKAETADMEPKKPEHHEGDAKGK